MGGVAVKKIISGIVVGILLCGVSYSATEYVARIADFKVFVDGEEFKGTTGEVLEVEGCTYLPLRDMGNALGVPVEWNDELRQVEVKKNRDWVSVGRVVSRLGYLRAEFTINFETTNVFVTYWEEAGDTYNYKRTRAIQDSEYSNKWVVEITQDAEILIIPDFVVATRSEWRFDGSDVVVAIIP
ncbi:hypothetical protein FACS189492_2040 [Clostridia bacterium]|nr:hypothetical protein FACS189492_2040 [Clostridia bacterium]